MKTSNHIFSDVSAGSTIRTPSRRGGAVIIMVVSLMTTLVVLGLFYYSFATQERASAEYFATRDPLEIDPDPIFNFGEEQLIVGTRGSLTDSALWGNKYSLLANMIGRLDGNLQPVDDVHPFNGTGLRLSNPNTSNFQIYVDDDSSTDVDQDDFVLNFSRSAHGGANFFTSGGPIGNAYQDYTPDAGYTYPDLNSLFLAMDYIDDTGQRVIIPSFSRPGYMKAAVGTASSRGKYAQLMGNVMSFGQQSLRPHYTHVNAADSNFARFVATEDANANNSLDMGEDRNNDGVFDRGDIAARSGDRNRILTQFPFTNDINGNSEDTNGNGILDSGEDRNSNSRLDGAFEFGVWDDVSGSDIYELDVDVDGDGIRDSIVIDLDHPIIDLPNGRQVVPLYAFKVIDADALLNLNAHGNMALYRFIDRAGSPNLTNHIKDFGDWISQSSGGMSRSEINLGYALANDTSNKSVSNAVAFQQHRGYFGANVANRRQLANSELAFLLSGRPDFDSSGNPIGTSSFNIPGRYGEATLLDSALGIRSQPFTGTLPAAGETGDDDDRDSNTILPGGSIAIPYNGEPESNADPEATIRTKREGRNGGRGYEYNIEYGMMPIKAGPNFPSAWNPVPLGGMGEWLDQVGSIGGATRTLNGVVDLYTGTNANTNPTKWPEYIQSDLTTVGLGNRSMWQNQIGGLLNMTVSNILQPEAFDFQIDEPDEMILSSNFSSSDDAPFAPFEMAGLHLSDADWNSIGAASRIRSLAPFNFEISLDAVDIRKRFTTDSRDRLEFSMSYNANRDFETQTASDFPPSFNGSFRNVLRRLLRTQFNDTGNIANARSNPQHRLDINRLLVNFDSRGNPIYRQLMPHPAFASGDSDTNGYLLRGSAPNFDVRPVQHYNAGVTTYDEDVAGRGVSTDLDALDPEIPTVSNGVQNFAAVPLSATAGTGTAAKFAQEVWARYDRQRMARDIFMLLYTVGLEDDFSHNPADLVDDNNNLVDDRIELIAQFAVNYVDALDRDDVITRFEYDPNPGNGWNVTDTDLDTDEDGSGDSRAFVHGIEHQALTFSEALWIVTEEQTTGGMTPMGQDFDITLYDDEDERQYLYIELRNTSTRDIVLKDGTYRIERDDDGDDQAEVYFEFEGNGDVIEPGETYLISTQDGTVRVSGSATMNANEIRSSDFYLDHDGDDTNWELAIPYQVDSMGDPTQMADENDYPDPLCDLDLAWPDASHTDRFNLTNIDPNIRPGYMVGLNPAQMAATNPDYFNLILKRRRNLDAEGLGESEWVEVDRFTVQQKLFDPSSDNEAGANDGLNDIPSDERYEPLDPKQEEYTASAMPAPLDSELQHSMSVMPASRDRANQRWLRYEDMAIGISEGFKPYSLWQAHFDRDFISRMELLSVPIIAPEYFIADEENRSDGSGSLPEGGLDTGIQKRNGPRPEDLAAWMFLNPKGNDDGVPNLWYRMLEFVTVGSSNNQGIYDDFGLVRHDHAKVNLNTLRHAQTLAGIIDDDFQFNADTSSQSQFEATMLRDEYNGGWRNWWDEMRLVRDGEDAGSANTPELPGTPLAKPFRPMSFIHPDITILRSDLATNAMVNFGDLVDNPLQDTILRFNEDDSNPNNSKLGLFEARSRDEVIEQYDNDEVRSDVHLSTANRLLGKIDNHTTVRSNVFLVWVAIRFHDAHQPDPSDLDVVQIGGVADGLPIYRQFLVVDRTRLEEAYDPNSNTFDFQKFIIHRQQLP